MRHAIGRWRGIYRATLYGNRIQKHGIILTHVCLAFQDAGQKNMRGYIVAERQKNGATVKYIMPSVDDVY